LECVHLHLGINTSNPTRTRKQSLTIHLAMWRKTAYVHGRSQSKGMVSALAFFMTVQGYMFN